MLIYSEMMKNLLNLTIEERVAVLETQVVVITDDIADLDEDVNFLFDETVIQDERLFSLEEETNIIDEEVEGILRCYKSLNVSNCLIYYKLSTVTNSSLSVSHSYSPLMIICAIDQTKFDYQL